MFFRRNKQRWDPQPTEPAGVIVASDGRQAMSSRAVADAAALAAQYSCAVSVVTIAKIYGTQFGIPHPGLMPSKRELIERTVWVEQAVSTLKRSGVSADGQVASTRHPIKSMARIALTRGASVVVIDGTRATGLRRLIEGDPGAELRRRLRGTPVEVRIIPAA